MKVLLDHNSIESYRMFLRIKALPRYRIVGRMAEFPDEYAAMLGTPVAPPAELPYTPLACMFDYQAACAELAIRKKKFGIFMKPGYGKTLIFLEFARHALRSMQNKKSVLITSPLMIIKQTMDEASEFYKGKYPLQQIRANELKSWMRSGNGIGITNYEAITDDLEQGNVGCIIIEEAQMLKSAYGKWGTKLIDLGRGLEWKMTLTGTPAPNDRIEYANHAVFLDAFPNVNSFLARFFVNRGQTSERWVLKPHALEPFYRALSHFSIFVNNPATYGWKDNCQTVPPIFTHIHDIDLTQEQQDTVCDITGSLVATTTGGITSRATMGQIAKGNYKGRSIATAKPQFIRDLVNTWQDKESTLIWCRYNPEQELLSKFFPEAASISGDTPIAKREQLIDAFKRGGIKTLISKGKILGLGLNLQKATRHVFSTCADSYEEFVQCLARSNRVGSTLPLNAHVPLTELERPMYDNVIRKAKLIEQDTWEQERLFKSMIVDGSIKLTEQSAKMHEYE